MCATEHQTDPLHREASGRYGGGQGAFVQGSKTVGDFQNLVEVLGDNNNGRAFAREVQERLTDRSGGRGINEDTSLAASLSSRSNWLPLWCVRLILTKTCQAKNVPRIIINAKGCI